VEASPCKFAIPADSEALQLLWKSFATDRDCPEIPRSECWLTLAMIFLFRTRITMNKMLFPTAALLLGTFSPVQGQSTDVRPSVLHIVIDDLGVMDVGFMGDVRYHTPNMDRLASEGMVFTQGYAPAANCAPSRAATLTGQYPMRRSSFSKKTGRISFLSISPILPFTPRYKGKRNWWPNTKARKG